MTDKTMPPCVAQLLDWLEGGPGKDISAEDARAAAQWIRTLKEPVAYVNSEGFIIEREGMLIAPGTSLYLHPSPTRAGGDAPTAPDADAKRWRTLVANFGNERDEATPGKSHIIRIALDPDGCEVLKPDGSLDFAATLAAIMDDEARIQSGAAIDAAMQGGQAKEGGA